MFTQALLEPLVNELASLPHKVAILSPYSFSVQPLAVVAGSTDYQVVIERAAFEMRATVILGYLNVALRSAVHAGAVSNPTRLERLANETTRLGWEPQIVIDPPRLSLGARRDAPGAFDLENLALQSCAIAVLMSEFVLDQLAITRAAGETRPAVERPIPVDADESSDPWLYDPTERDRSTAQHRALENWLMARLGEAGLVPLDPAGEPFFDLAWYATDGRFVPCEVKSTRNSEVSQIRLGLGQVLHYIWILRRAEIDVKCGALLIEGRPKDPDWVKLAASHGVVLFWPERWLTSAAELGIPS